MEGFKGELPREAIRLSLHTRQTVSKGAGMGVGSGTYLVDRGGYFDIGHQSL